MTITYSDYVANNFSGNTVSTLSLTAPQNSIIVVMYNGIPSISAVPSISDTQGLHWYFVTGLYSNGNYCDVDLWYAYANSALSTTVSVTASSGVQTVLFGIVAQNFNTSTPIPNTNLIIGYAGNGQSNTFTENVTPTTSSSLLFSDIADGAGFKLMNPGPGYTFDYYANGPTNGSSFGAALMRPNTDPVVNNTTQIYTITGSDYSPTYLFFEISPAIITSIPIPVFYYTH